MARALVITATDLHQWANRLQAQAALPVLLRRLVHASLAAPSRVDFPGDEGITGAGWDGLVETAEGNTYVPKGRSLWEVSVEATVKRKADRDFEKRSANPGPFPQRESAFVFVTLRRWGGKRAWEEQRKAEGIWADVRAYDASDLEQWLEIAVSVQPWLARILGREREDLRDLEDYWDSWSAATTPSLSPAVILSGRAEASQRVRSWIEGPPSVLYVQADTVEEGVCFLSAVILSLPDERREAGLSKSVVASSSAALRELATAQSPLIIASLGEASREAPAASQHVLVSVRREAPAPPGVLLLPALGSGDLEASLTALGLAKPRIAQLVRESGGRLGPLRRALASRSPERLTPWSTPAEAPGLVPFLLAGACDESRLDDRLAIERIARRPYGEVGNVLVRWLNESDPPVRRDGNVWRWVSRTDGWRLLARYVTRADLEAFEATAIFILGVRDPRFDLPPDERWLASIREQVLPHSAQLREGLCETLALMACLPESSAIRDAATAHDLVAALVGRLLFEATAEVWASLSDLLPLLAEAAPDSFLDAVDALSSGNEPPVMVLFTEEKGGLSPHSYHTGLLWALEGLAWAPDLLPRVAVILGRLSRLDPGGGLANRPRATLRHIFLGWYPQTSASIDQRLAALDALSRSEPAVGWEVLLELLPRFGGDSSWPLHKPRWRLWAAGWKEGASRGDYQLHIVGVADRLLAKAGTEPARWTQLAERLGDLPAQQRDMALQQLEQVGPSLPEQGRNVLWDAIRGVLHSHRKFATAEWTLPASSMQRLAALFKALEPADPAARYAWLFSWQAEVPDPPDKDDWHAEEELLARLRAEVSEAIVGLGSAQVVLEIAAKVAEPLMYGHYIGLCPLLAPETPRNLLDMAFMAGQDAFVAGIVSGCFARSGWEWASASVTARTPDQQARILGALPFEARTWDLAKSQGDAVEAAYWQTARALRLSEPTRDGETAVRRLLEAGRPWAALFVANRLVDRETRSVTSISDDLLAEVLERAPQSDWRTEPGRRPDHIGYTVGQLLDILRDRGVVARARLARIEWLFLPALSHGDREPRVLHEELATSPSFFAEVVSWVFRPDLEGDEEPETPEASDEAITRRRLAFELLHSWARIPGQMEDGGFDGGELRAWVIRAREECAGRRRGSSGDDQIGRVLARAPTGPDGIWPAAFVRDLIEELSSVDLENAVRMERYNLRGVVTRGLRGGGDQERELARRYRDYASAVAAWPRTAALLRKLAHTYESEARSWDVRSDLEE